MNTLLNLRVAALATLVLSSLGAPQTAIANSLFSNREVNQSQFAIVASPYGGTLHQLLILKQISNVRPCWSESGSSPTLIDPLLVQFDFTDICSRSTDSNGYSMRVGGEDQNWRYNFRIVRQGGDLRLIASSNVDRSAPELVVARARGYTSGFAKLHLEPGWRLTERTYQGSPLGHLYLTNDQSLASLNAATIASRPVIPTPITATPNPSLPTPSTVVAAPPSSSVSNPVVIGQPAPVVSTPKPTVQTPQPRPNQGRTWWQRIFGGR